ncbi:ABC transporter permease subunit [Clostridium sp. FP1]|uniref:ABC transporter permease subunit n=1 Tax=Clostridium sp. FP1 TaxID=2724076 RepID=UPI0013E926C2|nr:ABC transporter permease subunit [Clostridium sp. FP1]MBZ9633586.1 ABC transporter permease subunit [Clostridium sp. FP1]
MKLKKIDIRRKFGMMDIVIFISLGALLFLIISPSIGFSAIGLVWNSMMSWSGGWFFLMACEMFRLKGKDFRLPGLGSYLQTASNAGDKKALFWGILTLILVIVLLDQLIWRPVIAWSDKFKVELTGPQDAPHSFILTMIRRSVIIETVTEKALAPLFEKVNQKIDSFVNKIEKNKRNKNSRKSTIGQIIKWSIRMVFIGFFIYSTYGAIKIVSDISVRDLAKIPPAVTYSFLRVAVAQIIALAWTVPLGVAVGMNKKIANILQPIIQVIASIPATAIFPVVLAFFINIFGGLSFASILLMLLGTQWYILFNVIAGAMSIPEDLKEAAKVYGLKGWKKWKILILPSIFPYLLTGMVTATGGCWNASIVSEYVSFGGQTVSTIGLGALISEATETGNFPLLIVSTIVMCIVVVCVNKVLWKKLYSLSEERFKIEI